MSKKRFWNDKVRFVFYGFSLAMIIITLAYISILEHRSSEIFSADQTLPFMVISLIGIIPLLFSSDLVNKKAYAAPIIVLDLITFFLISFGGNIMQVSFPLIVLTNIANIYIFRKKPLIAIAYALPCTLFFLYYALVVLDVTSVNHLLFAAFTIAPALISDCIIAFLISKSQRQIKK